jgi:hypothetical protein
MAKKKVEKDVEGEIDFDKDFVEPEPEPVTEDKSFLAELYELKAKLGSLKITRMSDLDGLIEREILKK